MPDETHEMMHASSSHTLDYQVFLEKNARALGQEDKAATTVFRNHHLPGQNQEKVERRLLDPEEYVIRVRNPHRLVARIKAEQKELARNWRAAEFSGVPPLKSIYEVILGDPRFPEHCYRHTLLNAQATPRKTVLLTLRDNVEHDKGNIVGTLAENTLLKGNRTGQLTKHQRPPIGVTTFLEDTLTTEIDLTQDNLWIVVASAAAIDAYMKKSI